MESHISATQAARNLSDLLSRVYYRREVFVIERGGNPICRIEPAGPPRCTAANLVELLRTAPKPDPQFWGDLERIVASQPPVPDAQW